ncbi:hypothetical protein [Dyella sp. 20L07]|uniref:hypothetical protein n=1 Tax=Dyella sp. 20L07 TaxID=3384240 RepID=UPI003D2AA726
MQTGDRSVNWGIWRHMPDAMVYEAVALSLDIDPKKVRFHRDAWMVSGEVLFDERQVFEDRMMLAKANTGKMKIAELIIGDAAKTKITLASFAEWAIGVHRNIPEELRAMAGKGPEEQMEVREKGSGQSELSARERTSMLRVIRALSIMANVDKRGATRALEKPLKELGFDGPREATIRGILKEASDLQP